MPVRLDLKTDCTRPVQGLYRLPLQSAGYCDTPLVLWLPLSIPFFFDRAPFRTLPSPLHPALLLLQPLLRRPPTSSSFATLPFLFSCRRLAMRGACIPGHTLPPDGLLPFLLVRETSRQRGHYSRFPFRMYSGILRVSRRDWRQFCFGFVVNANGRGTLVQSFKVSRVFWRYGSFSREIYSRRITIDTRS